MTAQDIIQDSRLTHVRELKGEVQRLRAELTQTHGELESIRNHFALALLAARDGDDIPPGGHFIIIDGWNVLLGSAGILRSEERRLPAQEQEERLLSLARAHLRQFPHDRIWIVFDGARMGGRSELRLRVSFTGGTGPHRADHMVCDYLKMRRFAGNTHPLVVVTEDRDFRREAEQLGATVRGVDFLSGPNEARNSHGA